VEARTFPSKARFSPPEPVDFACVAGSLCGKLTSPNFVSLEDQKRTLQCSALTAAFVTFVRGVFVGVPIWRAA
jgi:hypothetical protein